MRSKMPPMKLPSVSKSYRYCLIYSGTQARFRRMQEIFVNCVSLSFTLFLLNSSHKSTDPEESGERWRRRK